MPSRGNRYISRMIRGIPYCKLKSRGDHNATSRWNDAVRLQTMHLPKIREACLFKATFFLPPNKYPTNLRYGPDLDNLVKRLLDVLNDTIFSDATGGDSCNRLAHRA